MKKRKLLGCITAVLLSVIMLMTVACGEKDPVPGGNTDPYIKTFDVPAEALTCIVGDSVAVPEVKAVTRDDEEIVAAITVSDPNGGNVTLDSKRFKADIAGTYVITYTITYEETKTDKKTRNVVASPKPEPQLELINDFETADDIYMNPDEDSAIWVGDNAQAFEDYTLNSDPQYVYNGDSSLKIAMAPKSANYWPGLKFLRSNTSAVNDFSQHYSVSMMLFNDSAQTIWLKMGVPGKDVKLDAGVWTKAEILVSEMQTNGMAADNLLNNSGSFYFWFTFESTFSAVDLYVDAVYAQPKSDTQIDYDTPSGFVTVDSFTVASNQTIDQNQSYTIVAPAFSLSSGDGVVSYKVIDPDGEEVSKVGGGAFAAGDSFVLEKAGKYQVVNTLTFDGARTRVKSTVITSRIVVVDPKDDIVYADFNVGLTPNLADMGDVWANDGGAITHNTDAAFAKGIGSAKFSYTVAAGQWPSFRFSNGKFPGLDSAVMSGIKCIKMEIYNDSEFDVTIAFSTVTFTLVAGQWNSIVIEESKLTDAQVNSAFHFFITSNSYTVGQQIALYVDDVVLGFN